MSVASRHAITRASLLFTSLLPTRIFLLYYLSVPEFSLYAHALVCLYSRRPSYNQRENDSPRRRCACVYGCVCLMCNDRRPGLRGIRGGARDASANGRDDSPRAKEDEDDDEDGASSWLFAR